MEIGRDFNTDWDNRRNRKRHKPFKLAEQERLRGTLIVGKTGTGKTTLIENMFRQDVIAGHGICVIDLSGRRIEPLLSLIPEKRYGDVILLDFADREHPVGFNVFHGVKPENRSAVAGQVADAFRAASNYSIATPQMDMVFLTASLALLDAPDTTMIGIYSMLSSPSYMARIMAHVKNPVLREIWEIDYGLMAEKDKRDYAKSVLNKVIQLITDPVIRNVIGQSETKFDVREAMDTGKILLVSIPQGTLGKEKARTLGSLLLSLIHSATLSRPASAPFFAFYCPDFQLFHGWPDILSDIGKANVAATVSTKYLQLLDEETSKSIENAVGNVVSFQLGPTDAEQVSKMTGFKASELSHLLPFHAHVSTGAKREHLIMAGPLGAIFPKAPAAIRKRSRAAYGTPKVAIERRIETFVANTHEQNAHRTRRRVSKKRS